MTTLSLTNRIFADLRAKARERRAFHHLGQLDDHMLRDIGLSRGEIRFAVREGR